MRLVYTVQNLLPGDCRLEVQPVYKVSEPTSRELSAGGEACLYRFCTYLRGTASLYSFLTYLQGTVRWGVACSYGFQTYIQGTVNRGCRLLTLFPNLPQGNCLLGVQLVYRADFALWLSIIWLCCPHLSIVLPLQVLKFYKSQSVSFICIIENSQHYFFHCRNYQACKHELSNGICLIQNPFLQVLLYGDPVLPEESNGSIFDHIHKYILKSRRFWCDMILTYLSNYSYCITPLAGITCRCTSVRC